VINHLKKLYTVSGFVVFACISLLDMLALKSPLAGKAGVVFWLLSFSYLGVLWGYCLFTILRRFRAHIVTILSLVIMVGLVLMNTSNPRNVSGETTQEINCAMRLLKTTDLGFHQTCLFGYPARQFFLPALPSIIWGRSLTALNLGGGLYFVLGIVIFSSGVLKFLDKSGSGDLINGILMASIYHFHYFNHFMFYYEQSVFPLSLGLIVVGTLLHYLATHSQIFLVLLAFSLLYLIFSYTPSLALVFLVIGGLLYLVFSPKHKWSEKILLMALVNSLLFSLLLSTKFRSDINIFSPQTRGSEELVSDLKQAFYLLVFQKGGVVFVSPMFNFVFVSIVVMSLLFVFGNRVFVIGLWMVATIVISVIAKGYTYYGADFRLHRALVIIPIFLSLLALAIKKFPRRHLFVLWLILLTTGLSVTGTYLKSKSVSQHFNFIRWIQHNVPVTKLQMARNLYVTTGPTRIENLISFNDTLQYFIPRLTAVTNYDCQTPIESGDYLITLETESCDLESYKKLGMFRASPGAGLVVYEKK